MDQRGHGEEREGSPERADDGETRGALKRLTALRERLVGELVERDEIVDGALAALVAGHHVLLLGPPGTAKSLLARCLCEGIAGARFFSRLLTRFSTPEELFGPLDLAALEDGRYERRVDGYLPTAHVAFLDEVFKASSAILNALLSVMNERLFDHGTGPAKVPLLSLVGASNEVPDEAGLAALYDRFLVRYWVEPIREREGFVAMLRAPRGSDTTPAPEVSLDDLALLRAAAAEVHVGEEIFELLFRLRRKLDKRGLFVSDRRYRQIVDLLRAYALLQGSAAVGDSVLWAVEACLWTDPDEIEVVRDALSEVLAGYDEDAESLVAQGREVIAFAQRRWPTPEEEARAVIEAHAKLTRLLGEAEKLVALSSRQGRVTERVRAARDDLAQLVSDLVAEGF